MVEMVLNSGKDGPAGVQGLRNTPSPTMTTTVVVTQDRVAPSSSPQPQSLTMRLVGCMGIYSFSDSTNLCLCSWHDHRLLRITRMSQLLSRLSTQSGILILISLFQRLLAARLRKGLEEWPWEERTEASSNCNIINPGHRPLWRLVLVSFSVVSYFGFVRADDLWRLMFHVYLMKFGGFVSW